MNIWKRELRNQDGRWFGQEWLVEADTIQQATIAVANHLGVAQDEIEDRLHSGGDVWDQFSIGLTPGAPMVDRFCPDCLFEQVSN